MKTDALFYELIKELPQIFFELIGEFDVNLNAYEFTAPEIKQQAFRLDGLFSTLTGFDDEPLYFVEFQTYKDEQFYERLFGEIFVYFRQYQPANQDWYAIVIYDRRSHEVTPHPRYQTLLEKHLRRVYINELPKNAEPNLGIGVAKLFIETPIKTASLAQRLINQTTEELLDEDLQQKMVAFIQAIVFYKFPHLTLEEIETMLDLSEFRKSRLYESVLTKTKIDIVPKLLEKGLSVQEVAEILELDAEEVRKAAR